jgi:hypothetical protein
MHIDWASLATVGVVAAAVAVTVVLLVAFALVALSPGHRAGGPDRDHPSGAHSGAGTTVAVLCLLAAGLIVGYGLHLIVA